MADEPQVLVPVPGRVLPLPEVPDPVFAGAMVGPSVAVDPPRGPVRAVAPVNGRIVKLHPARLRGRDRLRAACSSTWGSTLSSSRARASGSWPPMSAANVDEGCFAFDGLVLQSQFSALLLIVGATSGGLMASSPDRPGKCERRIDRWAPDQAGQQPAQLGD